MWAITLFLTALLSARNDEPVYPKYQHYFRMTHILAGSTKRRWRYDNELAYPQSAAQG